MLRAKAFCDAIATRSDGIVSVRVEEWVGTLTEGDWKSVSPRQGGFSHRFATHVGKRSAGNGEQRNRSPPRTGEKVECVLMVEKTRRGGRKAKLVRRGTEGPITNSDDLPRSVKAGHTVMLRVDATSHDGRRIQFHW